MHLRNFYDVTMTTFTRPVSSLHTRDRVHRLRPIPCLASTSPRGEITIVKVPCACFVPLGGYPACTRSNFLRPSITREKVALALPAQVRQIVNVRVHEKDRQHPLQHVAKRLNTLWRNSSAQPESTQFLSASKMRPAISPTSTDAVIVLSARGPTRGRWQPCR